MPKKIIIACGSGALTSKTLMVKVGEYLEKVGIDAVIENCRFHDLETKTRMNKYDLLITASPISNTYGVTNVLATSILIGVGADKAYEQITSILKDEPATDI